MANYILSKNIASISELKKNPMATVQSGHGDSVVILNRNEPAFYCVPPAMYEVMMEVMEDLELSKIIKDRENERSVSVNLDDYL
ncbi:type II toxin-antitoxin system Phd/YefM family antitoxin [Tatumella sp. JGM130]|uniref:type II toxin-antitoxin system Phd/YefM family antitoxin n=1 Tax=Tatumella sp. JGM130 TaxID=2799797 RepID=UPI001BAE89C3|nr:type II toxin-antitoxin system Phd/YefM family antitoxin [Tatumella sp. JGM130]